jgi:alpha-tubulin suppressor-like RCC1 family protein
VYAWGLGIDGDLANGTMTDSYTATPTCIAGASQLPPWGRDTALLSDGSLLAWGPDCHAFTGVGGTFSPTQIPNMPPVVDAAAWEGVYGVTSDGAVWAVGPDDHGNLGDGTVSTTPSRQAVQVVGLPPVKQVAAFYNSGFALANDGSVYAWGGNEEGELGNGTTTDSSVPLKVPGLSSIVSVAAGLAGVYAIRSDGTVFVWGPSADLFNGSPPQGGSFYTTTPVAMPDLTGPTAIAVGLLTAYALMPDGTVEAWGDGSSGELGNGTEPNTTMQTPVAVQGLTGIVSISAGEATGYAVRSDGTGWAWGYNLTGELGNGTTTNSDTPVQIEGLANASQIAGGINGAFAITRGS